MAKYREKAKNKSSQRKTPKKTDDKLFIYIFLLHNLVVIYADDYKISRNIFPDFRYNVFQFFIFHYNRLQLIL